jgi:hypothetical protein
MDKQAIKDEISALGKERAVILRKVINPQPMLAGGFVERWLRCGKVGCRCRGSKGHGPYYYLSVLDRGKPRMIYLGRGDRLEVGLLRQYRGFQRSIARLNSIHRQTIGLLWRLAEAKIKKFNIRKGV